MTIKPYVYAEGLAGLTPWSVEAIRKKVQRGELRRDVHYFQDGHRGRLIFKWAAVVELIERGADDSDDGGTQGRVLEVEQATAKLHRLLAG